MRTAWLVRITPCVAPATMPGSSRGHQSASTSRHGFSVTLASRYSLQSPIRRKSPSACAQFWSVTFSVGAGISSSRPR